MFGGLGNLGAMKGQMEEVKKKLETLEVEGEAGGGSIKVKMNAAMRLLDVEIMEVMLSPERKDELQDLIVLAMNEATRKATELSQQEMKNAADSIFPGLSGMLG